MKGIGWKRKVPWESDADRWAYLCVVPRSRFLPTPFFLLVSFLINLMRRVLASGVRRGMPPAWAGYRWVREETLPEHLARTGTAREVIHPEAVAHHPLPRNVAACTDLPNDAGWWGYSMRDVPARRSAPTLIATIENARVLPFFEPDDPSYFRPAILTADRRSLEMREVSFRPAHTRRLRTVAAPARRERATWVLERVYDNYSHWLTAHLPKFVLLRDMGRLDGVLLPPERAPVMDASLRRLGLDLDAFDTFEPNRPLDVGALTVLATDRFRPELLRPVREAMGEPGKPHRRVFISRARATRRRLLNEEEVWPLLERTGFERVCMEDLDFDQQVALMGETAVLAAPHGAGLTNMMFCPEGAHVIEIADLSFPNPNFYALASAMGHAYWFVPAQSVGDVHPLEKDLRVSPASLEHILREMATS